MVAEIKAQRCRPTPDVHESRHCKLCPAARHCPAKNALIQAALDPSRSPTANIDLREEMDVARVGLLFERLTIMHDAIGGLLADIRSRAWYDDIPLPNGKVLHRQYDKGKRQVTDADKLYELLVERHGQRVADAAIKRESSIERTREALKGAAGVKSVAKELAAVLEIAKERGAVTQKPSERVVETTPEKIENQQARLLAANE
jgi:hypothetical protein